MSGLLRLFLVCAALGLLMNPAAWGQHAPTQLPLPVMERVVDDQEVLVRRLFAEVKKLAAENEELRRQLSAQEHPLPQGLESPARCAHSRWAGFLGQHYYTTDEVLHPYPESVRLRAREWWGPHP